MLEFRCLYASLSTGERALLAPHIGLKDGAPLTLTHTPTLRDSLWFADYLLVHYRATALKAASARHHTKLGTTPPPIATSGFLYEAEAIAMLTLEYGEVRDGEFDRSAGPSGPPAAAGSPPSRAFGLEARRRLLEFRAHCTAVEPWQIPGIFEGLFQKMFPFLKNKNGKG